MSTRRSLRCLVLSALSALVPALRFIGAPSAAPWPRSLSAHVARGVAGTIVESAEQQGVLAGARAAAELTRLIVDSLLIFPAQNLPLGLRILRYRKGAVEPVPVAGGRGVELYAGGGDGPLVLFVHGGSWGQGAAWQYALLARRLIAEGASRVAVVKYGLFPEADVDEMVQDVAAALEWARQEQQAAAAGEGGRRLPVVLAAQSAGAHLCALLLARRCGAAASAAAAATAATAAASASPAPPAAAAWLPDRFVALSGVFDIAPHFAHESGRLVHWLSPMWLAMRGRAGGGGGSGGGGGGGGVEEEEEEGCGVDGGAAGAAACAACAAAWPPTLVLHAADDSTVPVRSAREFVHALRGVGGAVTYREVAAAGHGEIMVALNQRAPLEELPADLAEITAAFVREATAPPAAR